jgi:hypothetical protein
MSDPSRSQSSPLIRTSPAQSESIATAIVRSIEQVDGTKPDTPLYEAIEPDALNDLYQHASPEVSFEYAGYSVTIHADQTVTVSDLNT